MHSIETLLPLKLKSSSDKEGIGLDITDPEIWLDELEKRYAKMAAFYKKEGMHCEAELFAKVVEEFKEVRQDWQDLSND